MMRHSYLWIIALALLVALGISACGDDDHAPPPGGDTEWPTDTNTWDTDTNTYSDTDTDTDSDTDTDTDSDADTAVPDVVGMTEANARAAIQTAGLTVSVSYECSGTVPIGTVISQDPAGGTVVSSGSEVAIVVSGSGSLTVVINDPPFDYEVTTSDTITISGASSGNMDLGWSNNFGGSGSITPGDSWQVDIPLTEYNNKITITGDGICGEAAITDEVTVTFNDTTAKFLDRVAVTPHELFTGASEEIKVEIALGDGTDVIQKDTIKVVELSPSLVVGDTMTSLKDDGITGDDAIAGDGIYTGVFDLTDTATAQMLYYQVTFDYERDDQTEGVAYSEVFTVDIVDSAKGGGAKAGLAFAGELRDKYRELQAGHSEDEARRLTFEFVKNHRNVELAKMNESGIWRKLKSGREGILRFDGHVSKTDAKKNSKRINKIKNVVGAPGQSKAEIPLGNPLAIIYSPFYTEFSSLDVAFEDSVRNLLNENDCPPYALSGLYYLKGNEAGVEAFRHMSKNGLVLVHTLSSIQYIEEYSRNEVVLLTGQQASASPDDETAMDLAQGRLIEVDYNGVVYYAITADFVDEYGQYPTFPDSLVYLAADDTAYRDDYVTPTYITQKIYGRGAEAVFSVQNIVQGTPIEQSYLNDWSTAFFGRFVTSKENSLTAYAGATADLGVGYDSNGSFVSLFGGDNSVILPVATNIINPSFEEMIQVGWASAGDARVIPMLGPLLPKEGDRMAIVGTGLGSVDDSDSYFGQGFCVPEGMYYLNFSYDVISEEPMEWIEPDAQFDDTFQAKVIINNDTENPTIVEESVNSSTWYPDGGLPTGDGGVDFHGGDHTVYHTGWVKDNLIPVQPGDSVYLTFRVWDTGDSFFDTVAIIDRVQLQSGTAECTNDNECATGEWCEDTWCSTCNQDAHCGTNCDDCTTVSCEYGNCDDGYKECFATGNIDTTTCVDCVVGADCSGGYWCSDNSCSECNQDAHCGPDCLDCDATACVTGNCDDGTQECVMGPVDFGCVDCEYDSDCIDHYWCSLGSCISCGDYEDHCGLDCVNCSATACGSGNCDDGYQECNGSACVDCVESADCAASYYCNLGTCAPCGDIDNQCGSTCQDCTQLDCDGDNCDDGYKVCDGTSCVDCVLDGECAQNFVCNAYYQCVQCEVHADCANGEYCNTETNICEACEIETNCGGSGVAPPCVDCTAAACSHGYCDDSQQECDPSTLVCEDCVYDADCTGGYWCDTSGADNACVQCNDDEHCGSTCDNCAETGCVYGNCDDGKQVCNGTTCVDCVTKDDCDTGFVCNASNQCEPTVCDTSGQFAWVNDVCWYYGASGQNCNGVCADHAGFYYSEQTLTYAGSGGTDANCKTVCDEMDVPGGDPTNGAATTGLGCYYDKSIAGRYRETDYTTESSAGESEMRRVCACEECNVDEHCGTDCYDCTSLTCASAFCDDGQQVCDDEGKGCVDCTEDADCGTSAWCEGQVCMLAPLLYYPFDNDVINYGTTTGSHNGTWTNGSGYWDGIEGASVKFSSDIYNYVTLNGTKSALSSNTDYTLGLWFKEDSVTQNTYLMDFNSSYGGLEIYHGVGTDPILIVCYSNTDGTEGCSTNEISYTPGVWHHLLIKWDWDTFTLTVYLDNEQRWNVDTVANVFTASQLTNMLLGRSEAGDKFSNFYLDEFKVFNANFDLQGQCETVIGGTWDTDHCVVPECYEGPDCPEDYYCNDGTCELACPGGGVEAEGLPGTCWYLGSSGESCNSTCGNVASMFVDESTAGYAGDDTSGGTNAGCTEVMNALGIDGTAVDEVGDCPGTEYDGYCWVLGGADESCTDICTAAGGAYNAATCDLAGASDEYCATVTGLLGADGFAGSDDWSTTIGCHVYSGYGLRETNGCDAAGYTADGSQRVCACGTGTTGDEGCVWNNSSAAIWRMYSATTTPHGAEYDFQRACACREPGCGETYAFLDMLNGASNIFDSDDPDDIIYQTILGDGSVLGSFRLLLTEGGSGVTGEHLVSLYNEDAEETIASWGTGDLPADGYSYYLCFMLPEPFVLEQGVTYSINVFPNAASSQNNDIAVDVFTESVYPDGQLYWYDGKTSTLYGYETYDMALALYGYWCAHSDDCPDGRWCYDNECVPEPSCAGAGGVFLDDTPDVCWYLAANLNDSCTTACTSLANTSCNVERTRNYAGNLGSEVSCDAVLDALDAGTDDKTMNIDEGTAAGCFYDPAADEWKRDKTTDTTCEATRSDARRACACELATCASDGNCDDGYWCDTGTCSICNVETNCGDACDDCTKIGCASDHCDDGRQECKSDGTGCVECNYAEDCAMGYTCSNNLCVLDCAGAEVGGYCWFFGAAGVSCETVCSSYGGYNEATKTYAGSSGTNANCGDVLDALGAAGSGAATATTSPEGDGCVIYDGTGRYRITSPETTAGTYLSTHQRACACGCTQNSDCSSGYWCSDGACVSSCAGTLVGGYCWYLGGDNESCNDACTAHGGYNAATHTYAGSGASDSSFCEAVLDGLGVASGTMYNGTVAAMGCYYSAARYWRSDEETTSTASWSGAQRACACNQ